MQRIPKAIPALSSHSFPMPRPNKKAEHLKLRYNLSSFQKLPSWVPWISEAGYRVLGKLYYKGASATIKELGTHGKCVDALRQASLIMERRPSLLTLTPHGHKIYELIFYQRLEKVQLQDRKEFGLAVDLDDEGRA
jgi:hypothetical protein